MAPKRVQKRAKAKPKAKPKTQPKAHGKRKNKSDCEFKWNSDTEVKHTGPKHEWHRHLRRVHPEAAHTHSAPVGKPRALELKKKEIDAAAPEIGGEEADGPANYFPVMTTREYDGEYCLQNREKIFEAKKTYYGKNRAHCSTSTYDLKDSFKHREKIITTAAAEA